MPTMLRVRLSTEDRSLTQTQYKQMNKHMNSGRGVGAVGKAMWIAAVVGVGMGMGGCASKLAPSNLVKVTHERAVEMPAGAVGAMAVDVSNACGSVEVRVDPRWKSPKVEWFAIGDVPGAMKEKETEWVATDVAVDHGRAVLRVLGSELDGKRIPVRVLVMIPACAGVRVRNSEGPVRLMHVSGAVDVVNGVNGAAGGDVTAVVDGATKEPISVTTTSGNVNVELARGTSGNVKLTAPVGRVSMKGGKEKLTSVKVDKSKWMGVVNGGENAITLNADDGQVRLVIRD